ncbi:MAG: ABC transporter ATP-binding protein, partial [Mesorhizobium sp.]
MRTDATSGAAKRGKSFVHVAEASWGKGLSTLLRIVRMTLRHPWQVAITIISTFIAATLQLFIPRLLGRAIDQAQGVFAGPAAEHALWNTALTLLVVSILRGLFTMAQNYYGEAVGHRTGYELRLAFYEKIQRLSFSFHDRVHTGDLITLGLLDLDGVRMFFSTGILRVVLLGVLIGVGAYLLISTDLVLGLLSLSFVPFVAWRSSVTQLALRSTWLTLQERLSVLSRVMDENLGGIRVVRAFAAQRHELEKFDSAKQDALDLANQRVGIRVSNTSAMNFSFLAAMGLVLWFGGQK